MPDDKSMIEKQDQERVTGTEDDNIDDFAEEHDLTPDQVRELIAEHGNDREDLETAIAKRNAE